MSKGDRTPTGDWTPTGDRTPSRPATPLKYHEIAQGANPEGRKPKTAAEQLAQIDWRTPPPEPSGSKEKDQERQRLAAEMTDDERKLHQERQRFEKQQPLLNLVHKTADYYQTKDNIGDPLDKVLQELPSGYREEYLDLQNIIVSRVNKKAERHIEVVDDMVEHAEGIKIVLTSESTTNERYAYELGEKSAWHNLSKDLDDTLRKNKKYMMTNNKHPTLDEFLRQVSHTDRYSQHNVVNPNRQAFFSKYPRLYLKFEDEFEARSRLIWDKIRRPTAAWVADGLGQIMGVEY